MAERRMFAKSVIGSARFLRMPPSSRLLYYDLGMAADDDGVVEAFSIMRTTGAVEDDLKVLVSKGFVTVLNEDLVAYIVDWSKNNQIRKDRYQPSIYQNLLVQIGAADQLATDGQPDDNQRSTQYRLGKDRLGKVSLGEGETADKPPRASRFTPPTLAEVQAYVSERQSPVDPQGFLDFYAANGWMVGKTPMKDWKAACRNAESWERWTKQPGGNRAVKPGYGVQGHHDELNPLERAAVDRLMGPVSKGAARMQHGVQRHGDELDAYQLAAIGKMLNEE